jgi:serine/threonine protein kinase
MLQLMHGVVNQRLLREIRVLAAVNHPNISPLLGTSSDFDRVDRPCLVFPYQRRGEISGYLKEHPGVDKLPLVSHNVSPKRVTSLNLDPDRANYQCFIVSSQLKHSTRRYQSGRSCQILHLWLSLNIPTSRIYLLTRSLKQA